MERRLPLIAKTINELIGGKNGSFATLFDLELSVPQGSFTREDLAEKLNQEFSTRVQALGGTVSFDDTAAFCKNVQNKDLIVVQTASASSLTDILFCTKVSYSNALTIDPTGLFDSVPRNIIIESDATISL